MKIRSRCWLAILLSIGLASSLTLVGCTNSQADPTKSPTNNGSIDKTTITADASSSKMKDYLPRLEGKATVELVVNDSKIVIEVDGNEAPVTAGNFVDLVERGVYDRLAFHRVVKDPQPFVVQAGDPQGKDPNYPVSSMGTGSFIDSETGRPRYIPLEIKLKGQENPIYSKAIGKQRGADVVLRHSRGAVAMARSNQPDSASSQFYIALADLAFLDGDYAVFGYVTEGIEAVDAIKEGDRISSARVIEGLENLKR